MAPSVIMIFCFQQDYFTTCTHFGKHSFSSTRRPVEQDVSVVALILFRMACGNCYISQTLFQSWLNNFPTTKHRSTCIIINKTYIRNEKTTDVIRVYVAVWYMYMYCKSGQNITQILPIEPLAKNQHPHPHPERTIRLQNSLNNDTLGPNSKSKMSSFYDA